jgi:hypothetical protein
LGLSGKRSEQVLLGFRAFQVHATSFGLVC